MSLGLGKHSSTGDLSLDNRQKYYLGSHCLYPELHPCGCSKVRSNGIATPHCSCQPNFVMRGRHLTFLQLRLGGSYTY